MRILLIIVLALGASGCDLTSNRMNELGDQAVDIIERVEAYQAIVADLAVEVAADGLIKPDVAAKISEANIKIDELSGKLSDVAVAVGATEFSDGSTLLNALELAAVANRTVGAYPFSGLVSIALGLLTSAAGAYGTYQAKRRKRAEGTIVEIVNSIDAAKVGGLVTVSDISQQAETRVAVAAIRAS